MLSCEGGTRTFLVTSIRLPPDLSKWGSDIVSNGLSGIRSAPSAQDSWSGFPGCTQTIGFTEAVPERDRQTACQTVPGQTYFGRMWYRTSKVVQPSCDFQGPCFIPGGRQAYIPAEKFFPRQMS